MSLLWYLSGAVVVIYSVITFRFCPTFISQRRMVVPVDLPAVRDDELANRAS